MKGTRGESQGGLAIGSPHSYNICMNIISKIAKHGNSQAIPICKEVLAKLRVGQGDSVYLTETPTGFHISAYDPQFEAKMAAAEEIMREDRDILCVLAK